MTANIEDTSCPPNNDETKFPSRNNIIKPLLKQTTSFVESNDNFVKRKDAGRRASFSDEVGQNLTEYYTIESRPNKGETNMRLDGAESSRVCCIS